MDPTLRASMIVLAVTLVLAALCPAPRKAPPGERIAYPCLIFAGLATYVTAAIMPFVGMWVPAAATGMFGTALILICLWLARSPMSRERRTEEDRDEGRGGGGGPKVPEAPRPPRRPTPEGPALDWSSFDDARAGWERPARDRDRELVGV